MHRFAGATVAIHESRESGDRLVTDLGVGITSQNLNEVSYNIGDADIPMTAPLTGETMESTLADRRDGIPQSPAKGVCGHVAGVMVKKGQAEAPHRWIRMTECGGLHRGERNLLAETRSAFLPEREPSMDKIICNFEV